MTHSVRFRLIRWLGRIFDQPAKDAVQVLRDGEVQSNSTGDLRNLVIVSIPNDTGERQYHNAHMMAGLKQNVDVMNRASVIPDFQSLGSQFQIAPTPNHDFVHDPSSKGGQS